MERKKPEVRFADPRGRRISLLATTEEESELRASWAKEDIEKLYLLGDYYNLDPTDTKFFQVLALSLAREFLPERKKIGRKNKWTDLNRAVLVVEVERRMTERQTKAPLKTVCHELSRTEPWISFIEEKEDELTDPDPGEVVERMYQVSKKLPMSQICKKAFLFHEEQGSLSEWNAFVKDIVNNPHSY